MSARATVGDLLEQARSRLAAVPFEAPPREAALLLAWVLGVAETRLYAFPETTVEPEAAGRFDTLLERRLTGEPIAYLLGEREFYGRAFRVDDRVLVPRPETEHLIEVVLGLELPERPRALDLGTGSGCIAITLALEIPGLTIVGVDDSPAALAVARSNRSHHAVEGRLELIGADLASATDLASIDLVVSNPPYIDPAALPGISPEVTEHEPRRALVSAEAGTAHLRAIARGLAGLSAGVPLVLEIGHDQADRLPGLLEPLFELEEIVADYAGKPRIALAHRTQPGTDSAV